jgi:hypothetical protein
MKIRSLVAAFVFAVASLNPFVANAAGTPQFTVYKPTLQIAWPKRAKCKGYGESCMSRPAPHDGLWHYDGLVDNCCSRWICLYPGPTCQ